jgi:biotin-dependent carboxylase-like uncharacterized protein
MIEIVAIAGLATIQDAGRPGRMHEGVPPGGALVPDLLSRANAAARNARGEAAIEVFGGVTLTARDSLLLAADDGVLRCLRAGERWTLGAEGRRVRYVAVRGGIDVPSRLGGRGTLLVAGLGGQEGRALRRGDVLSIGRAVEHDGPLAGVPDLDAPVRVVPGPDRERFAEHALRTLLASAFVVSSRSDRVGVRLVGPALQRADGDVAVSGPMVRGAIQVPSSGEPIVLGPDHPTTGGYPVLATVVGADAGAVMARPIGASVRFVLRDQAALAADSARRR